MGKHDKNETKFTWEPPKDDYYKAEIVKLQAENARLRDELHKTQMSIGNYELAIDHQDEVHDGIVAEYQEMLDEKDGEIAALKMQIEMLKEAVVKGALREVLA